MKRTDVADAPTRTTEALTKTAKRVLMASAIVAVGLAASGCLSVDVHHETDHPVVVPDNPPPPPPNP
jgi:hypothetical protein